MELRAGDCFLRLRPGAGTQSTYEIVPCDAPHDGEVATVIDCTGSATDEHRARTMAAAAAYIGVPVDEFIEWFGTEGLDMLMNRDAGGPSVCFLKGRDGRKLTRAYGWRRKRPMTAARALCRRKPAVGGTITVVCRSIPASDPARERPPVGLPIVASKPGIVDPSADFGRLAPSMTDLHLQGILAEMASDDPDRGLDAASVAEWLTAGEGVELIDLATVQRFAWYQLPVKWLISRDDRRRVLVAAAELFDRLGMPVYAELCRSPETEQILDAYEVSSNEGMGAYLRAYERSGVKPPDLDDFAWGDVFGVEEAAALSRAEQALEEALAQGTLRPGAGGWKSTAKEITSGVLDAPHPTMPGQTHRTAIVTERLDAWLRQTEGRSPVLHRLRSRHANRLLHPLLVPTDVGERMQPVTWFLGRIDEGARLTQAGYLPTAMVREAWERFPWAMGWTDRPPRSETELVQLHEIHRLLRRLGAVRRRGNALLVSTLGRRMLGDPERSWRTVSAGLSEWDWPRAVAEVFALLVLDGEERDRELEAEATRIIGETGWRTSDGEPPGTMAVSSAWWVTWRPLAALGGIERAGDWMSRTTRLSGFGEATLLEQIRAGATGPRMHP